MTVCTVLCKNINKCGFLVNWPLFDVGKDLLKFMNCDGDCKPVTKHIMTICSWQVVMKSYNMRDGYSVFNRHSLIRSLV